MVTYDSIIPDGVIFSDNTVFPYGNIFIDSIGFPYNGVITYSDRLTCHTIFGNYSICQFPYTGLSVCRFTSQ